MLKDFKYRFFDDKNHKQGILAIVTALDFMQADEFAYQIAIGLGKAENNDWDKETTHYERIK